jgi:predicted transcriptional regulator
MRVEVTDDGISNNMIFPPETWVIDDVDWVLKRGETVAMKMNNGKIFASRHIDSYRALTDVAQPAKLLP